MDDEDKKNTKDGKTPDDVERLMLNPFGLKEGIAIAKELLGADFKTYHKKLLRIERQYPFEQCPMSGPGEMLLYYTALGFQQINAVLRGDGPWSRDDENYI